MVSIQLRSSQLTSPYHRNHRMTQMKHFELVHLGIQLFLQAQYQY